MSISYVACTGCKDHDPKDFDQDCGVVTEIERLTGLGYMAEQRDETEVVKTADAPMAVVKGSNTKKSTRRTVAK